VRFRIFQKDAMTKTKDPESEAMNCPIWLSKLCLEENLEEAKNQYVN
jgi:hypothetical protein